MIQITYEQAYFVGFCVTLAYFVVYAIGYLTGKIESEIKQLETAKLHKKPHE